MIYDEVMNVVNRCIDLKMQGKVVISLDYVLGELAKALHTDEKVPQSDLKIEKEQIHYRV